MVRSTSSTASGSSATRCARRRHGAAERGELADAQHLARLDRRKLQFAARRRRRACPPSRPAAGRDCRARRARRRRQRVDVVAADAAKLARETGGDLVGLAPRRARAAAAPARRRRAGMSSPRLSGSGAETVARAVGQDRVDGQHVVGHQPVADRLASRRSCCRPCRRWCSAHGWRDRPGRTGRAASAPRSAGPARGRARPAPCRPLRRPPARGRRCLEQSITSARLTVWPHWLVPPPRGQHRHAFLAGRSPSRRRTSSMVARHDHADSASSGRSRRRWRSGRGRRRRTGFLPGSPFSGGRPGQRGQAGSSATPHRGNPV